MENIKKYSPPVPHLLQAQQVLALLYSKAAGHPDTGSYPAPSPSPTTQENQNSFHVFQLDFFTDCWLHYSDHLGQHPSSQSEISDCMTNKKKMITDHFAQLISKSLLSFSCISLHSIVMILSFWTVRPGQTV